MRPALPGRQPVSELKGVGPAISAKLEKLGIRCIQDLWFHLPLRYEDRTRIVPYAQLEEGEPALFEGTICAVEAQRNYRSQLRVGLTDAAGNLLWMRFFHFYQTQVKRLHEGATVRCFGEPRMGYHGFEMVHPDYRLVTRAQPLESRLTPVYPTTAGLGQKRLAALVDMALDKLPTEDSLELIPATWRKQLALPSLRTALLVAHRPPAPAAGNVKQTREAARQRLVFEELLAYHLSLHTIRQRIRKHGAPAFSPAPELQQQLLDALPFQLTAAQKRVNRDIQQDIVQAIPMMRLVQGDVGSGKTIVAALAAVTAVASGQQVALVAPTELLAEQHWHNFCNWLQPLGLHVAWLSGRTQGKKREKALQAIAGDAQVVVGTHALMQEGVNFAHLGLVIIDEQHRFGVHQRLALRNKGQTGNLVPHQLVLTATPIPRTLAMSVYADLDVSVIDELPPGRKPVDTVVLAQSKRAELIQRLRGLCADGRQVYWVCTLIEESDVLRAQAAEDVHAELSAALPEFNVGLVHGRLKASAKQQAMQNFKEGATTVLVATTVIEVGVDVPNASVMVIENAERLGLAQLHQLRGRVGRGKDASNCILLYQPPLSRLARQRLDVMRHTNDGFVIAEKDLALRGPGEVLGTRQTGDIHFRVADLATDAAVLTGVQHVAQSMLREYPREASALIKRWIGDATEYVNA